MMELGEIDMMSLALHQIPLAGRLVRPRLKRGTFIRNETWQARQLATTLAPIRGTTWT
jgi:hypothetical protein